MSSLWREAPVDDQFIQETVLPKLSELQITVNKMTEFRITTAAGGSGENCSKRINPKKHVRLIGDSSKDVLSFLGQVAVLSVVQRVSRTHCPLVWHTLQALQFLCFPPLKSIQRWAPFNILVKYMQKISRPLLFVSVITIFSDRPAQSLKTSNSSSEHRSSLESLDEDLAPNVCRDSSRSLENVPHEDWVQRLKNEIGNQGLILPERMTDSDISRFYKAVNGDFSCLLSAVKRTIKWRETYYFLSTEELKTWSHLVFWHGPDLELRPCLVIRLGLACSTLSYQERPCFTQAIVSQIEHGVLNLVKADDPRITVLMDCEGISTVKFPVHMLRSFSLLLQDHYPNCLAVMYILRLPPVARLVAKTMFQGLRPGTREKLLVVRERFLQILSENIQSIPSFLGGSCTCSVCALSYTGNPQPWADRNHEQVSHSGLHDDGMGNEASFSTSAGTINCDQLLRTSALLVLMFWIFIALIVYLYDFDALSFVFS